MLGIILAFLTAISESLKDVFGKKSLQNIDEYVVTLILFFFPVPILAIVLSFLGLPIIGKDFWWALIISGTLNLLANILYFKAIKSSDLSITVPMIAFTPIFLLITSPIVVGEFPSIIGLLGVILIFLGSYTLNIKKRKDGWLVPFKALLKEKGPKLMLGVAFIWSITSVVDKVGVVNSSPFFWIITKGMLITLLLMPFILLKKKQKQIIKNWKSLVPVGIFSTLIMVFHQTALLHTLVIYVISIKRISVVFSVLMGYFIFKEKGVKERLLGAVIMVVGVLLIVLG